MIIEPRLGKITQGTIFCGAIAEDYECEPVWGVVITARCDTTHDKTPIINYLPTVRIEDWLNKQGGLLTLERALGELANRFKNFLGQQELSSSLVDVYTPSKIMEKHFPKPSESGKLGTKQKEKPEIQRARDLAIQIEELQNFIKGLSVETVSVSALIKKHHKVAKDVISELFSHRLAGYYYLPELGTLTESASEQGYVVLLREVHHLPKRTARLLVDGIAMEDGQAMAGLCSTHFDFAYPVAEIQSPWIEHLMQAFCNLFNRIGVSDLDKKHIDLIMGLVLLDGVSQ